MNGLFGRMPWVPYVAPFAAFLLLTGLEAQVLPKADDAAFPNAYALIYVVKIVLVALIAVICHAAWRDLLPWPKPVDWAIAIGLGLLVAVVWVGLDAYYPRFGFLGTRAGFDPSRLEGARRAGFLGARLFGLVVVVPLIEELFWRSFLMRWIINSDFKSVPIGKVTLAAGAITSVLFALEHPEWLPAFLTGAAWAWLLAKSRSVSACWISHAVANAALGAYVLGAQRWEFL